jgi:hypothetical protein
VYPTMNVPSPMQAPRLLTTVQNCLNVCESMVAMMLSMPDVQARRNQILLLQDCATICATLACYLARSSIFAQMTAGLCARICEACGNECARFSDQASQSCSRVCLSCAQECRAFATAG